MKMRRNRARVLATAAILALMLFLSSFWLPPVTRGGCGSPWSPPCLSQSEWDVGVAGWEEPGPLDSALRPCPGQSFQSSVLMRHLRRSLSRDGDVLMEPYLETWDQLILFMESLGTMVRFFSHKLREKVALIRQLSVKHQPPPEDSGKRSPRGEGLQHGVYGSVVSMVDSELDRGLVGFSFRTESGSRTLLRLHRSLLWVQLVLQGLVQDPDQDGVYRSLGDIAREAYGSALAPHHSWFLRGAAELVFVALPDTKHLLRLVCVDSQSEAGPALRIIIRGLSLVHRQTQTILERRGLLHLP